MYDLNDEFMISLVIVEEEDGLYECYIPELNQTLHLSETELDGLTKV